VISGASWNWLGVAVVANAGILVLAAWQWKVLLPIRGSVGFGRLLWITAVTSTVSNGGPFLTGHATAIFLLATRGKLGYASAVSMKALEQFIRGVSKLLLFGLTLALVPLPVTARRGTVGLFCVVVLFGLVLLLGAHRGQHLEVLAHRWTGWRSRVVRFLASAADQLEALRQPRVAIQALILDVAQRALEGLAIWAVLAALGIPLPLWGVLLVLSAVNLSTMASLTPGNVGIYEGSAVVAYGLLGIDAGPALGISVLQHLAYLVPMAGCGWMVLLASRTPTEP